MIVLLDTDQVPERQRADALHAAFRGESPQRVLFSDERPGRHRMELVDFGPGAHLLRSAGSALHITRDARHVRMYAPESFVIGFQRRGESLLSAGGVDTEVPAGNLDCVDITRPYDFAQRGVNDHESLIVSNEQAGVSVDVVRAAAPALARSPVYDLVRGHVAHLFGATRELPTEPRLLAGQATIALIRALLITAAEAEGWSKAMDDALEVRITLYIDGHLSDRDLSAERIAAAHNISLRQLYNIWARAGHDRSLTQWIIDRRLQRAHEQLATLDAARSTHRSDRARLRIHRHEPLQPQVPRDLRHVTA